MAASPNRFLFTLLPTKTGTVDQLSSTMAPQRGSLPTTSYRLDGLVLAPVMACLRSVLQTPLQAPGSPFSIRFPVQLISSCHPMYFNTDPHIVQHTKAHKSHEGTKFEGGLNSIYIPLLDFATVL
jgi:hypothetical protein